MRLVDRLGIPMPQLQYKIADGNRVIARVDAAWPEIRLVVEVDGAHAHATAQSLQRDLARQNAARAPWLDGSALHLERRCSPSGSHRQRAPPLLPDSWDIGPVIGRTYVPGMTAEKFWVGGPGAVAGTLDGSSGDCRATHSAPARSLK